MGVMLAQGWGGRGWASSWGYKGKAYSSSLQSAARVQLRVASPLRAAGTRHHEVDGGGLALPPPVGGSAAQVRWGPAVCADT